MLSIGRWKYDAKRCLSIYCRTPAEPDDKLKDYIVSPEAAMLAIEPLSLIHGGKRKRPRRREECTCIYIYLCIAC